jgi:hypothetical protein
MGPRREEQRKPEPRGEPQPKRFRLIRLEERIAPGGYQSHGKGCATVLYCTGDSAMGSGCCNTSSCSIE